MQDFKFFFISFVFFHEKEKIIRMKIRGYLESGSV